MSLNVSRNKLARMTRELTEQWGITRDQWRDDRARRFQEDYLDELVGSVQAACIALENLDRMLQKVRTDCE